MVLPPVTVALALGAAVEDDVAGTDAAALLSAT